MSISIRIETCASVCCRNMEPDEMASKSARRFLHKNVKDGMKCVLEKSCTKKQLYRKPLKVSIKVHQRKMRV